MEAIESQTRVWQPYGYAFRESSAGRWSGRPFTSRVLRNSVVFSCTQWRNPSEGIGRLRHCKQLCGRMEIPLKLQSTCSNKLQMKRLKELLVDYIRVYTTSTKRNDQQKVSICLIFIHWRFSVQFMTPKNHFTPSESNGLVYEPHPRFFFYPKIKQKSVAYTRIFTVKAFYRITRLFYGQAHFLPAWRYSEHQRIARRSNIQ